MARATGLDRDTIASGLRELDHLGKPHPIDRVRRPGAGRKSCAEIDPRLLAALDQLIDPFTRGDPSPALALDLQEHPQPGQRTDPPGTPHQPAHGSCSVVRSRLQPAGQPQDTRRGPPITRIETPSSATSTIRSLFGNDNSSQRSPWIAKRRRIWAISRTPEVVAPGPVSLRRYAVTTSKIKKLGKAVPYGIYDLANNEGWVSVGVDHDTARVCGGEHRSLVAADGLPAFPTAAAVADHGGWRW